MYYDYDMLGISILLISVVVCLAVAILVISKGLRDKSTRVYAALTFFLLLLVASNYMAIESQSQQLLSVRLVMISTTFAVYLLYLLVRSLRPRKGAARFYKTPLFYVTCVVAILNATDFLFTGVVEGKPPTPIPGPGVAFFFAHMVACAALSIWTLYKDIKHTRTKRERLRYRPLIIGIVPIGILAPFTSFILPFLGYGGLVVLTPVYVLIFVTFVGYSILRHGLLDVRLTVVRTFTYGLTLTTLALAYFGVAYLVTSVFHTQAQQTTEQSIINVGLALLLAFIFQPVKRFFDRVTNLVFFRDSYDTGEFFSRFTRELSAITDLYYLLHFTVSEISGTLKSEFGAFYIHQGTGARPISVSTNNRSKFPEQDMSILDAFIQQHGRVIIMTSRLSAPEDMEIRRLLVSHRIEITLPVLQEGAIKGYLFLGDHRTSRFTERDIKALETIAGGLAIAIHNTLSLHEVKNLNATLQQRVDSATKELRASNAQLHRLDEVKDEFISMASHQLRTPLTSIKGYISMLLEGDVGKVSKEQARLLQEAFNSSERMVRLISDFLNVSRLQTGKFVVDKHPVDLVKLVQSELDALKQSALTRGHSFTFKQPKDLALVAVDENKLQQVIMNFADNALYYSKEPSVIKVSLRKIDNAVQFTIKDSGIGVPKEQQEQLFTKFFRATNARKQRPDGTGVGLFLAKKVIDAHDGEIIFASTEGKGSTFGFRLPIKD